jgi:hypothetical protein
LLELRDLLAVAAAAAAANCGDVRQRVDPRVTTVR